MKAFLPLFLVIGMVLPSHGFRASYFDIMKYMDCGDRIDPKPDEIITFLKECTQQYEIPLPDNVTAVIFGEDSDDNDDSGSDEDSSDYMSYEDYEEEQMVIKVVGDFLEELYKTDKEAAGNLVACSLQYKVMIMKDDPDLKHADLLQCTPNFVHSPEHLHLIVDCLHTVCAHAI
ncbi:uncharacterized protein LOC143020275 [Oratosquilla oratoria]|uniref:uncharacterized protein LOC143020275 n=1 Tax=Oratosquilla oratoria TaxID=337810 RepID=UPI003F76E0CF